MSQDSEKIIKRQSVAGAQTRPAPRRRRRDTNKKSLRDKQKAIGSLEAERVRQMQFAERLAEQAALRVFKEQKEKEDARFKESKREEEIECTKQREVRTLKIASIVIGFLTVSIFELTAHFAYPWTWLLKHPNGYGLEGCICLMIFFGILGFGVKQWRNTIWITGLFGILFVALQILGGP